MAMVSARTAPLITAVTPMASAATHAAVSAGALVLHVPVIAHLYALGSTDPDYSTGRRFAPSRRRVPGCFCDPSPVSPVACALMLADVSAAASVHRPALCALAAAQILRFSDHLGVAGRGVARRGGADRDPLGDEWLRGRVARSIAGFGRPGTRGQRGCAGRR